ncbi:MAG TPA: YgaP-like transmembrane domain [Dongiaceae bacterium]|nr:YgaP-like transmembrane domain [Dongiaceae bacterium]
MAGFFKSNIEGRGRLIRAVIGLVFFIAGIVAGQWIWWVGVLLGIGAAFTWFEAARGWCALRACGIKTKY